MAEMFLAFFVGAIGGAMIGGACVAIARDQAWDEVNGYFIYHGSMTYADVRRMIRENHIK